MGQPSIYRLFGMAIVSCVCAGFLSSGTESQSSAAREVTRDHAATEPLTTMRPAPQSSKETRVMLLRHADVSRNLGDYSAAERIVKELLALIENSLDADDAEVAIGLSKLGRLCVEQGKYAEAKVYYQHALTIIDGNHSSGLSANLFKPNTHANSESPQEAYPESDVIYQRLPLMSQRYSNKFS